MEVSHTNLFWWLFFINLHYSHYTPDWERTYKTDRFSCIGPDLELGLFHIIRTRKNIKKFDKSLVREFNEKCDLLIKQHICLNDEIFIDIKGGACQYLKMYWSICGLTCIYLESNSDIYLYYIQQFKQAW